MVEDHQAGARLPQEPVGVSDGIGFFTGTENILLGGLAVQLGSKPPQGRPVRDGLVRMFLNELGIDGLGKGAT
ncbi:MAG: hypothetical protein M3R21_09730 [Candidatus Dormibacteraeota bacterium]|nr:hypothetical protein [Candidatus Dormibacteraeota bacterium]